MERHARQPIRRAPASGPLQGEQLLRDPRSRRSQHQLEPEQRAALQASRDSARPRSSSANPGSPERGPFACPYAKHDPTVYSHRNVTDHEYRNCSTGYWTSIARLKQHLYRTHDRSQRCCERCWQNFPNDDQLRRHVQAQNCEVRPMPEEKMDAEQTQAVKERVQGKPIESWYKIYRILFPRETEPASPFAEWVTGQDLRNCFLLLQRRLPAMLFQEAAARTRTPQAQSMQPTRSTPFLTTAELIQRAILRCQSEFGQRTGLEHVFASGPPSPAASAAGSEGGEHGALPGSALRPTPDRQRHSQNVHASQLRGQEMAEDSSSSSDAEMSVDELPGPSHRHSSHSYGSSRGGRDTYQTAGHATYTTAVSYSSVTAPLSDEDLLQAQYIQDELYQDPAYDRS